MATELLLSMSEPQLQAGLIEAAQRGGWLIHHDGRADLAQPHGDPGFPDIIAGHPTRGVIAIECKREHGRYRPGQKEWLVTFGDRGKTVRPSGYHRMVDWLTEGVVV